MAWAWVQSKSANGSSSATISVTLTSTPTTGNKIIAPGTANQSTSAPSITSIQDGNSNSLTAWGTAGTEVAAGAGVVLNTYFYDAPASPSTTFTLTTNATGSNGIAVLASEYSGLATGNTTACVDGSPGSLGTNNTNPTGSPTYSSGALNELLLSVYCDWGANSSYNINTAGYTSDSGFTPVNGNAQLATAYKNTSNGAEAGSWTPGGASVDVVQLGAFKLPGAAPAPPVPRTPRLWIPAYRASAF